VIQTIDTTKKTGPKIPLGTELLPLLFAVLVVSLIAILSYRGWTVFGHVSDQLAISQQVFDGTDNLLSSLKDAETGQRGYLLTGEDRYLEPYRQALKSLPAALTELGRAMALPRPDQAERIEALKPLVQQKLDELRQTIELYQAKRGDDALAIVRSDRGKALMDQIRQQCAEIQQIANNRITEYSLEAESSANQIGLVGTLGSISLFILLVSGTIAIHKGTTRRQQLIEELRRSESQTKEAHDWLETTIASIGDGVISTDSAGRVTLLNSVAQSLTGWSQEQAAGRPLEEIFVITNEDTGAVVENPVHKALREGRVVGLANHTVLTSKDGNRRPIDDSAAPIRAAGGKVSGVVLVFRDVTERKEAEKQVKKSVERFELMADNAPVLIWMAGLDRGCTWFNKPWLDFVGRTLDQELGRGWIENLHPDDAGRYFETFSKSFDAQTPFQLEYRLQRRDGRYRWLLAQGAPLHGAKDEVTSYIGSCIDITDRKEAEEELQRANEDLNQFAFAASHDLQEPLRMITSYSQLLIKRHVGQLDEETALCVNFITDGTQRMRDLLADLLAYTQLAADGRETAGYVDLNVIFQQAVANLRASIDETHAVVSSDPLPRVRGEEAHFLQLFQNLVGNAIKYHGDAAPKVRVSASKKDSFWRVEVADNGVGIDPEYHQRIFGVFKRLHGKSIPGTGIGLAICQRVVERYGGRIWVDSRANEGSTFFFTLPSSRGEIA